MAFFQISKGLKQNLPKEAVEGYTYFTTDTGEIYIDTTNSIDGRTMVSGVPFINGTDCGTQGAWFALHPGLQLRNGLIILYKPTIDGTTESDYSISYESSLGIATAFLKYTCLTLNYGEWKQCYYSPMERLTTQFCANDILLMIYDETLDDNKGGWQILGNGSLDARTLQGHSVETDISSEDSDNIPTSGAVVRYVKSLNYSGEYDIENGG